MACPSPRLHSPVSGASPQWRLDNLQGIVRMYGFEGEAGREGEGWTRTTESSNGRHSQFRCEPHCYDDACAASRMPGPGPNMKYSVM
jgi:hypothetical protein